MIIKKIIKKFIPKSRFEKTVAKFKEDNKKHGLMLNYDLNENSLVFDVGGYKGQGASDIFSMYLPTIYIFEPRAEYAQAMEKRFKKNNKIKIFNFGLLNIITNLQIQFHNFFPDAKKKMMDIHKELRKTHNLVYQYEFVMENWQLKKTNDNN